MSRSIQYNNAGVACTEAGHTRVAWSLFKGALELKLCMERKNSPIECEKAFIAQMQKENGYIAKAESIYRNLHKYLATNLPDCSSSSRQDEDHYRMISSPLSNGSLIPSLTSRYSPVQVTEDLYTPFLFRHPMRLSADRRVATRKESATVIFNLALVDHLKNPCSEQAVQLYELAMTLLTGDVVDELGIALMNNIGAWCYENGDMDGTLTCMGHLSTFVGSGSSGLDQDQKAGLHANILWLSNAPFAASPAA